VEKVNVDKYGQVILSESEAFQALYQGQTNSFGNYKYRSCEDILTAVKPLLDGCVLTLSDEIVAIADRIYVKATARIFDETQWVETTAFAREASDKKGMDAAQITGSASSYARKYALNGLFCIDDTKDADAIEPEVKQSASKQIIQIAVSMLDAAASTSDDVKTLESWTNMDDELKKLVWPELHDMTKEKIKTLKGAK
jgi:hypothetical protein